MEKRLTKEEFLKDLWHPASEMPDKNRTCLVRVVYHPNHGMFQDEERIEQSSFHDFGWYDYDSKYTFKKESRFIPRLKNLYQKATIRWNKVNMSSANVSLFRSILRTSKECSRCKHFNGMLAGRCTKLHKYVESSDWCHGTFFHRK